MVVVVVVEGDCCVVCGAKPPLPLPFPPPVCWMRRAEVFPSRLMEKNGAIEGACWSIVLKAIGSILLFLDCTVFVPPAVACCRWQLAGVTISCAREAQPINTMMANLWPTVVTVSARMQIDTEL